MELQFSGRIGLFQIAEIESPEAPRQYFHGEEEAWTAGHPTAAVQGDSSPGHDTMQMGMSSESLPPGVQDAEKADLRAQVFRICCDRLQGLGGRSKQQIVHLALVLQAQTGERLWQRKHDMEILARQEFGLTLFQPLGSGQGLALGAMAIRARVVRVAFVAALVTSFQMAAERRRAAQFDSAQHALLARGQRGRMRPAKLVAMGAHNIGDFQCRPHGSAGLGFGGGGQRQQIQGAGGGADRGRSQAQIASRGGKTAVAEQQLNSAYIRSRFQQMDSVGVPSMPHAA